MFVGFLEKNVIQKLLASVIDLPPIFQIFSKNHSPSFPQISKNMIKTQYLAELTARNG